MPKIVNLALQGDGGHGAFTWGMLDRLLEKEALHFEGIAGTSAGAVDAVVLADGLATSWHALFSVTLRNGIAIPQGVRWWSRLSVRRFGDAGLAVR